MALVPGVHLLHKPRGVSSFAALRAFVEAQPPSAGRPLKTLHGGTLDPFADGLLLVLAGQAVHLFEPLHALPKIYEAELAWGVATENADPTGRELARADTAHLTPQTIAARAQAFLGWHAQQPPATSAKKIGGEPAYRKAHRGEAVTLAPSRVYLHSLDWLAHELPHRSRVRLVCRGGFYVRAFAEALAEALATRAHVAALRRTAIGPWRDPGEGHLGPVATGPEALPDALQRPLTDAEVGALRAGQPIPEGRLSRAPWSQPVGFPSREPELLTGLHRGRLLALLRREGHGLALHRELRGGI